MKIFDSILQIQHNYKGFILDIWGVLHASGIIYSGVLEALTELQNTKKSVLLVSNAPRRASFVQNFIKEKLNLQTGKHYNGILTSGELFFEFAKSKLLLSSVCLLQSCNVGDRSSFKKLTVLDMQPIRLVALEFSSSSKYNFRKSSLSFAGLCE